MVGAAVIAGGQRQLLVHGASRIISVIKVLRILLYTFIVLRNNMRTIVRAARTSWPPGVCLAHV